ncbi:hypothetical protein CEXT_443421 [Caerostris extrusa]|uniref:Uncharacterized protein n=1 Tax=Caerostris extrusa TaxID=172846 RepID=A0AAV4SZU7_CAEEX|nr:hypothetical protein CEXT_443421 [Caerostris extrusa]
METTSAPSPMRVSGSHPHIRGETTRGSVTGIPRIDIRQAPDMCESGTEARMTCSAGPPQKHKSGAAFQGRPSLTSRSEGGEHPNSMTSSSRASSRTKVGSIFPFLPTGSNHSRRCGGAEAPASQWDGLSPHHPTIEIEAAHTLP